MQECTGHLKLSLSGEVTEVTAAQHRKDAAHASADLALLTQLCSHGQFPAEVLTRSAQLSACAYISLNCACCVEPLSSTGLVLWQDWQARQQYTLCALQACNSKPPGAHRPQRSPKSQQAARSPSIRCKICAGLPEEVAVVKHVLQTGWAAVAFSSLDREATRCWEVYGAARYSLDSAQVWQAIVTSCES